jgi:glyoxylase-like metal-dependent hydrolase (beta-lactamase superfamily II)
MGAQAAVQTGTLPEIKLFAFFGGYETCDKSMLTLFRGLGEQRRIPFQYFLVEHPNGRLMFDTGPSPAYLQRPAGYPPARDFGSIVTEADLAPNRLAQVGLRPEQIDLVANSHLHYDHAGGNCFFDHAPYLVQFDELQGAMWPEVYARDNYCREDFDRPVHYEELDGDHDVFGDGSCVLIQTPGHTRGSQSLVLRLRETGTLVLAQDAVYLRENLDELVLAPTCWDQRAMLRSFRRLRDIRRIQGAVIVPGHDWEAWSEMRHAPDAYS